MSGEITALDEIFQTALAVGFLAASVRLVYTAWMPGRRPIRIFRSIGAVVTFLWSAFYAHAVFGNVDIFVLADIARFLQYMNLLMFLAWGFLWTENRWWVEAQKRLAQLEAEGEVQNG